MNSSEENDFAVPVVAEPDAPQAIPSLAGKTEGEARDTTPVVSGKESRGGEDLIAIAPTNPNFKTHTFFCDQVTVHPRGYLDLLGRSTPRFRFIHGLGRRKFQRVETIDMKGKTVWNIIELK
jgi:hypothetical protein